MMRLVSFILVLLFIVATVVASDRAKPIVMEARSPGPWLFNQADYQRCVTVVPEALQPRVNGSNVYPRRSDTA